MRTEIPLLQTVRVAAPCPASWEAMESVDGDRVRFCDECRKKVYNLSAMSQAEAEGLLRKHEGHLCVRYYRRRDGTILTTDCPVGLHAARQMVLARAKASVFLGALLCMALAGWRATQSTEGLQPVGGTPMPPAPGETHEEPVWGRVIPRLDPPPPSPAEGYEVGRLAHPPQVRADMGFYVNWKTPPESSRKHYEEADAPKSTSKHRKKRE